MARDKKFMGMKVSVWFGIGKWIALAGAGLGALLAGQAKIIEAVAAAWKTIYGD
jgi:hypothetical protein